MRCTIRTDAVPCVYEIHTRHSKDELVKQVRELKAEVCLMKQILDALCTDDRVSEVLQQLKSGQMYDTIVDRLDRTPIKEEGNIRRLMEVHCLLCTRLNEER
jgi:hypothetical protein